MVKPATGWTQIFHGSRLQADLVTAVLESAGLHPKSLGGIGEYAAVDYYDSQVLIPDDEVEAARELLASRQDSDLKSPPEPL